MKQMTKASNKNTSYTIRPAVSDDAQGISAVLSEIFKLWKSDRDSSPEHVRDFYIDHPDQIQCTVATDSDGTVLGFQSLKLATVGNIYDVTPGWGVIGTYVKLDAGRQGIGSSLFAATLLAAKEAGLPKIDASIASDNQLGIKYYTALGFQTYREAQDMVSTVFAVHVE